MMERGKSFIAITTVMILFATSGQCSYARMFLNRTADDVWDDVNKTSNIFPNLTEPALDNRNKNQFEGYLNSTILEPINQTIIEPTDERSYENSSILSRPDSLKPGQTDLTANTVALCSSFDQIKNMLAIMDIRIQLAINNTEDLKSTIKRNGEKLHTIKENTRQNSGELKKMNGYIQKNSEKMDKMLDWIGQQDTILVSPVT